MIKHIYTERKPFPYYYLLLGYCQQPIMQDTPDHFYVWERPPGPWPWVAVLPLNWIKDFLLITILPVLPF
ncbi:MAG TPA: hypothetical protein ENH49_05720 [Candidatus Marinimicrobia bacterium]|nr:hypothetical protein [Candidatus Neomarinimicrobiota bacterium]